MPELIPPAAAVEADDGDEVCRLWVADGDSHVALNYGMFGEGELSVWGMLVADVTAHVVRASIMNDPSVSKDQALALFERGFRERLDHNPTLTGSFAGRSFQ